MRGQRGSLHIFSDLFKLFSVLGPKTGPGGPGRCLKSWPEAVAPFSLSMGPWRAVTVFIFFGRELAHPCLRETYLCLRETYISVERHISVREIINIYLEEIGIPFDIHRKVILRRLQKSCCPLAEPKIGKPSAQEARGHFFRKKREERRERREKREEKREKRE